MKPVHHDTWRCNPVVYLLVALLLGGAGPVQPRPWMTFPKTPDRFSSSLIEVKNAGVTNLPREGLALALSLANKTDRTIWVTVTLTSPPSGQPRQVIKKLSPGDADLFAFPQSTFAPETDYPILIEIFLDESRTEASERNDSKFRFSSMNARILEKLAEELGKK